jgi:hypothetical protein
MGRIYKGSIILELFEEPVGGCLALFEKLLDHGYKYLYVTISPGYVYGRMDGVINQYAVSPLSFILDQPVYMDLLENRRYYIVERDAWIDTAKLWLEVYINTYNEITESIRSRREIILETNEYLIETRFSEFTCSRIVYMDGLNTQYSWITGRMDYMDEGYVLLLRDRGERVPREYVLAYAVNDKHYQPLLVFINKEKPVLRYSIPRGCNGLLGRYMFWSLVDILLYQEAVTPHLGTRQYRSSSSS